MSTLLFLLFFAQTDACSKAIQVKAFETTPCSGVLWPSEHTAKALEIIKVDLPACQSSLKARADELKVCDATIIKVKDECDKTIDRFAKLTKEAAQIQRPWWDNNTLWGGAGFVSGVIITVLIVSTAR